MQHWSLNVDRKTPICNTEIVWGLPPTWGLKGRAYKHLTGPKASSESKLPREFPAGIPKLRFYAWERRRTSRVGSQQTQADMKSLNNLSAELAHTL